MSAATEMFARDFKPCAVCGHGVGHTGLPLFWRVSLERMAIDARAVQRTDAMERYMGGHVGLARVFEDPPIAKSLAPRKDLLVCEECARRPIAPAALAEDESDRARRAALMRPALPAVLAEASGAKTSEPDA